MFNASVVRGTKGVVVGRGIKASGTELELLVLVGLQVLQQVASGILNEMRNGKIV